jgi:hypothetical protein
MLLCLLINASHYNEQLQLIGILKYRQDTLHQRCARFTYPEAGDILRCLLHITAKVFGIKILIHGVLSSSEARLFTIGVQ